MDDSGPIFQTFDWENMYIYDYIYIYMVTPPGAIRALGGVIILDNHIINVITCSKALQIPVKNAS